jgi:hypothetical protein
MLISPLKDTWHMLPLFRNNEKTYAHVGEKQPELGWLLLGDFQPSSEQCIRLLRDMFQSAARDTAPKEYDVWQSDARGRQPFIFMSI